MILKLGMSDKLGQICYDTSSDNGNGFKVHHNYSKPQLVLLMKKLND